MTLQSVADTPVFTRQMEELFTGDEKRELIDFLSGYPLAGMTLRRRVGFASSALQHRGVARSGRGKRGGARINYYNLDDSALPYALLAYAKRDQAI